jgi:hypothetical protein
VVLSIGVAQLEQALAPPRGFIRSAGGSGKRPEIDVGDRDRAGLDGVGRREGLSLTDWGRGRPPFYV